MRSWSVDMAVKKGMEKDNILAENGNSKVTLGIPLCTISDMNVLY